MTWRSQRAANRSRIAASVYRRERDDELVAPHNTVTTRQPVRTLVRDLVGSNDRLRMADLVASALPGATPYPWVIESLSIDETDI